MKNKKSVMAFGALQILIFHLWISTNNSPAQLFLLKTAYIGVDLFFFMSAYSLANRNIDSYKDFIINRFTSVYVKYVIFAFIAFMVSGWSLIRLVKVVTGIELFIKGGGAFLWFLPAIMIYYILFPFFVGFYKRNPWLCGLTTAIIWLLVGICITTFTEYKSIFIFWNRIPVFVLGFYLAKWKAFSDFLENKLFRFLAGLCLLIAGLSLIYLFGYRNKLMVPVADMFYVTGIPAALGIVMLISMIPAGRIISLIGSSTLEMYGIQMIFGYRIAIKCLKYTESEMFTNIFTVLAIIILSINTQFILKKLYSIVRVRIIGQKKN